MAMYCCDACAEWFDSREAGFNEHMGDYICDECFADREGFLEAIHNTPEIHPHQLTAEAQVAFQNREAASWQG